MHPQNSHAKVPWSFVHFNTTSAGADEIREAITALVSHLKTEVGINLADSPFRFTPEDPLEDPFSMSKPSPTSSMERFQDFIDLAMDEPFPFLFVVLPRSIDPYSVDLPIGCLIRHGISMRTWIESNFRDDTFCMLCFSYNPLMT